MCISPIRFLSQTVCFCILAFIFEYGHALSPLDFGYVCAGSGNDHPPPPPHLSAGVATAVNFNLSGCYVPMSSGTLVFGTSDPNATIAPASFDYEPANIVDVVYLGNSPVTVTVTFHSFGPQSIRITRPDGVNLGLDLIVDPAPVPSLRLNKLASLFVVLFLLGIWALTLRSTGRADK